jgi:hypothetical protein
MSPEKPSPPSTSPGGAHPSKMLEVDIEVAGVKHRALLSSKDIGAGGFFLRTSQPAPLWKKVRLSLSRPDGGQIEISGEVVRSVGGDHAASGQPTGMAIAFDEVSRGRQKEFVALVQNLAASNPTTAANSPVPPKIPTKPFGAIRDTHSGVRTAPLNKSTPTVEPVASLTPPSAPATMQPSPPALQPKPATSQPTLSQPATAQDYQRPEEIKKFLDDYKKTHTGATYYDTLGIHLNASPQEIDNAHQQLCAVLITSDPSDSFPSELASEIATILNKVRKAYAILSKPDRKRAYDFIIDNKC